ncbi:DUF5610 domain-containing protein [Aestuariibacter halophilus]|uniref:DUF5610 domain-containing protein n=1 Tax=Fluctibacter halophilus TaxID=226011 RepID=A0ABS8GCJ7_9ALTE|nr:DUF5610 domain-containing protein [Aestuariibacter halophilus]MCC2618252.1 DUF5610 domain-containing protein [Aestuariibacter halophilus]
MNIGDIKAFLNNKADGTTPRQQLQQELRDMGMKQAQNPPLPPGQVAKLSSATTVGLSVYRGAMRDNVSLDGQRPNLPEQKDKPASLFDFEEVAKNVLSFVGGAIKHAAAKGADEEKLQAMFSQAREGVLRGIKMAEKDLAGLMNDDIKDGIASSQSLIEDGIKRLEQKIFGLDDETTQQTARVQQSISLETQRSADLTIRTRDGDELQLRFEDLEQFSLIRQQLIEKGSIEPVEPVPVSPDQQASPEAQSDNPVEGAEADASEANDTPASTQTSSLQYQFYQQRELSFSLQGELDKGELDAIAGLVKDVQDLADLFFDGDVEAAYNKAIEQGFDEKELTGFALNLQRTDQVQVISAYENISHYRENQELPSQTVKPLSQYLDKMLGVMEQSNEKLQDGTAYADLINGIMHRLQKVQADDLVTAINRFHTFNNQLLNNLPQTQAVEATPVTSADSAE